MWGTGILLIHFMNIWSLGYIYSSESKNIGTQYVDVNKPNIKSSRSSSFSSLLSPHHHPLFFLLRRTSPFDATLAIVFALLASSCHGLAAFLEIKFCTFYIGIFFVSSLSTMMVWRLFWKSNFVNFTFEYFLSRLC